MLFEKKNKKKIVKKREKQTDEISQTSLHSSSSLSPSHLPLFCCRNSSFFVSLFNFFISCNFPTFDEWRMIGTMVNDESKLLCLCFKLLHMQFLSMSSTYICLAMAKDMALHSQFFRLSRLPLSLGLISFCLSKRRWLNVKEEQIRQQFFFHFIRRFSILMSKENVVRKNGKTSAPFPSMESAFSSCEANQMQEKVKLDGIPSCFDRIRWYQTRCQRIMIFFCANCNTENKKNLFMLFIINL